MSDSQEQSDASSLPDRPGSRRYNLRTRELSTPTTPRSNQPPTSPLALRRSARISRPVSAYIPPMTDEPSTPQSSRLQSESQAKRALRSTSRATEQSQSTNTDRAPSSSADVGRPARRMPAPKQRVARREDLLTKRKVSEADKGDALRHITRTPRRAALARGRSRQRGESQDPPVMPRILKRLLDSERGSNTGVGERRLLRSDIAEKSEKHDVTTADYRGEGRAEEQSGGDQESDTKEIASETSSVVTSSVPTIHNISRWRKADLVMECKRRGLHVAGTKSELVERILATVHEMGTRVGTSGARKVDESSTRERNVRSAAVLRERRRKTDRKDGTEVEAGSVGQEQSGSEKEVLPDKASTQGQDSVLKGEADGTSLISKATNDEGCKDATGKGQEKIQPTQESPVRKLGVEINPVPSPADGKLDETHINSGEAEQLDGHEQSEGAKTSPEKHTDEIVVAKTSPTETEKEDPLPCVHQNDEEHKSLVEQKGEDLGKDKDPTEVIEQGGLEAAKEEEKQDGNLSDGICPASQSPASPGTKPHLKDLSSEVQMPLKSPSSPAHQAEDNVDEKLPLGEDCMDVEKSDANAGIENETENELAKAHSDIGPMLDVAGNEHTEKIAIAGEANLCLSQKDGDEINSRQLEKSSDVVQDDCVNKNENEGSPAVKLESGKSTELKQDADIEMLPVTHSRELTPIPQNRNANDEEPSQEKVGDKEDHQLPPVLERAEADVDNAKLEANLRQTSDSMESSQLDASAQALTFGEVLQLEIVGHDYDSEFSESPLPSPRPGDCFMGDKLVADVENRSEIPKPVDMGIECSKELSDANEGKRSESKGIETAIVLSTGDVQGPGRDGDEDVRQHPLPNVNDSTVAHDHAINLTPPVDTENLETGFEQNEPPLGAGEVGNDEPSDDGGAENTMHGTPSADQRSSDEDKEMNVDGMNDSESESSEPVEDANMNSPAVRSDADDQSQDSRLSEDGDGLPTVQTAEEFRGGSLSGGPSSPQSGSNDSHSQGPRSPSSNDGVPSIPANDEAISISSVEDNDEVEVEPEAVPADVETPPREALLNIRTEAKNLDTGSEEKEDLQKTSASHAPDNSDMAIFEAKYQHAQAEQGQGEVDHAFLPVKCNTEHRNPIEGTQVFIPVDLSSQLQEKNVNGQVAIGLGKKWSSNHAPDKEKGTQGEVLTPSLVNDSMKLISQVPHEGDDNRRIVTLNSNKGAVADEGALTQDEVTPSQREEKEAYQRQSPVTNQEVPSNLGEVSGERDEGTAAQPTPELLDVNLKRRRQWDSEENGHGDGLEQHTNGIPSTTSNDRVALMTEQDDIEERPKKRQKISQVEELQMYMPTPAKTLRNLKPNCSFWVPSPNNSSANASSGSLNSDPGSSAHAILQKLARIENQQARKPLRSFQSANGFERVGSSGNSLQQAGRFSFHVNSFGSRSKVTPRAYPQRKAIVRMLNAHRGSEAKKLAAESLRRANEVAMKTNEWTHLVSPFHGQHRVRNVQAENANIDMFGSHAGSGSKKRKL